MKSIVLLIILCGLEVRASVTRAGSKSDRCVCADHTPTPIPAQVPASQTIEELITRTVEKAVSTAIARTKDIPTTPAPILEINDAVKQAMRDLTPLMTSYQTVSSAERDANAACQESVRNLTRIVTELTVLSTTPAPRCDCDEQATTPLKEIEYLTEVVEQIPRCGVLPGYEYSSVTGRCYKFHTENKVWSDANVTCVEEGGHLGVINSREEARYFKDVRMKVSGKELYIGVFRNSNDQWQTVTGEGVDAAAGFRVWATGEPWTLKEYRFGVMRETGNITTTYKAYECPFLCEKMP